MRQKKALFDAAGVQVFLTGPDRPVAFERKSADDGLPFPAIPDPDHRIAGLYGQEVVWRRYGRMPSMILVGGDGMVLWAHYGDSMEDIPSVEDVLTHLG